LRTILRDNYIGRHDAYKLADGVNAGGRFFSQLSFSRYATAAESSVANLVGSVENSKELKLFTPLDCGLQTGAASVLKRAVVTSSDVVAVIGLCGVGMAAIMARNHLLSFKPRQKNHCLYSI
jgi:Zn-dependent alcohol dehydrogenase